MYGYFPKLDSNIEENIERQRMQEGTPQRNAMLVENRSRYEEYIKDHKTPVMFIEKGCPIVIKDDISDHAIRYYFCSLRDAEQEHRRKFGLRHMRFNKIIS